MNFPELFVLPRRWWSPRPAFAAPPEDRKEIAGLAGVGRSHLMAARAAVDQRLFMPAATLYGHAIGCFMHARRLVAQSNSGEAGAAAAPSLEPAEPPPAVAASPSEFIAASPFGATEAGRDALVLLQERPIDGRRRGRRRRRALAGLDRVAASLGTELYPATEGEALRLAIPRQLGVVLLLLAAIAGFSHWLKAPRNVARGKSVTASSVRLGAPEGLVNGAIEWGTFALHTGAGFGWATIDLGDFYTLAFAEIYARGDGRLEFNLPLSVQLSDDDVNFRPAGSCVDIFTQASPCVVTFTHQRARFVRVSAPEIVLSEVEVYAVP